MSRTFAPPADRLQSVIARERQFPLCSRQPAPISRIRPRIYTEIAIEQLPGIVSFFQNDVPAGVQTGDGPEAPGGISRQSNERAIDA